MAETYIPRYYMHHASDDVIHVVDLHDHRILPARFFNAEDAQGYINSIENYDRSIGRID